MSNKTETAGVEEWEEKFNSLWKSTSAWNLHPHDSQPVIDFIHHQLQKAEQHEQEMYESLDANYQLMLHQARLNWLREEIVRLEEDLKINGGDVRIEAICKRFKDLLKSIEN